MNPLSRNKKSRFKRIRIKTLCDKHCCCLPLLLLVLMTCPVNAAETLAHDFAIRLLPASSQIDVEDTVQLPTRLAAQSRIHFLLHDGLTVSVESAGAQLLKDETLAKSLSFFKNSISANASLYS